MMPAVILDEAQNTTISQMKMFLTRLGFNSKMIVNGDTSQVDLPEGAGQRFDSCRKNLEGRSKKQKSAERQL